MASSTQWTWVWASSRSLWRTGKPGIPQSMGVTKSRTQLSNWITTTIPVMVLSLENRVFVDDQIKMKSLQWNQMQCDRCLCRKEKFWHRNRHLPLLHFLQRKEDDGKTHGEYLYKIRTNWGSWKLNMEQILTHSPQKKSTLAAPVFRTSSLLFCKTTNFYC